MTPTHCITKHNPPHSYGDCLRACVATILDFDALDVPNFADAGVDADAQVAIELALQLIEVLLRRVKAV